MREIKFRAWDKQAKKMYAPIFEAYKGNLHELLVSFSGDLVAHTIRGIVHESTFPDKYILMQFTGLKDKNGIEIYESDQVEQDSGLRGVIVFYGGCFCWENKDTTMTELTHFGDGRHYSVIGNIYEKS